jgi:hypothetical protein
MFSSDKKLEFLDFKGEIVLVHLTLVRCFGLAHKKLAAKSRGFWTTALPPRSFTG